MSINTVQTRRVAPRPWLPIVIVGLILLVILGAYYYNVTRPQPATVMRRDIIGFVALPGTAVAPPSAYAEVHAAYSAPVDKVDTTLGANVKRGEALVELSNPAASENYDLARQNVRAAETAYANAKLQYNSEVASAQKELAAAQAGARTSASANNGSTSPGTNDETSAPGSSSSGTTGTASPGTTVDVATAQQDLQQAIADRTSGLLSYQQQLDAAREAYREARAGKNMSRVLAPISGTVIALNAQPGKQVPNGAPIAAIANLDAVQIQAPMTPEQAGLVKVGMPVEFTLDTVPGKQFEGTIQRITTQADTSTPGTVKPARYVALLSFHNNEGLVKPNAVASISVKTGEVQNVLAVPAQAVRLDSTGRPIVAVLENGKWWQTPVQVGLSDGRYTEIKSGLQEGQTVQVMPALGQAAIPANR